MKAKKRMSTLKIVSISIVALFILIVIAGIVRDSMRDGRTPTQAETDATTAAVQSALNATGYDLSVRGGVRDGALVVVAANGSEHHTYVVDVQTGAILFHVEADGANASRYCERLDVCHLLGMHG